MPIGFVLIGVEPKAERKLYAQLLKTPGIVELYPLFGEYDIIAKVEAPTYDDIGKIVVERIRSLKGVRTTKTLARMELP